MAWTTPKTFVSGDVLTAAELNTYLTENTEVLQPIMGVSILTGTGSITSEADWGSAITISNPNKGKVGVLAFLVGGANRSGTSAQTTVGVDINLGAGVTTGAETNTNLTSTASPAYATVAAQHYREGTPSGDITIQARCAADVTCTFFDGSVTYVVCSVD